MTLCTREWSPRARGLENPPSLAPEQGFGVRPRGGDPQLGPGCAPTSTHMHGVTGCTRDPTVTPAPREGARARRLSMQCEVTRRHRGPPRGRGWQQRAGPVPVPSRPVGGTHAVTPGGWRALTAGDTAVHAQIIQ